MDDYSEKDNLNSRYVVDLDKSLIKEMTFSDLMDWLDNDDITVDWEEQ